MKIRPNRFHLQVKLTLPIPIPDEEKKLTWIFILTVLYGASKGFMKALKALSRFFFGWNCVSITYVLKNYKWNKWKIELPLQEKYFFNTLTSKNTFNAIIQTYLIRYVKYVQITHNNCVYVFCLKLDKMYYIWKKFHNN